MTAVRAVGLGKRYTLGRYEPYRTLRDAIVRRLSSPFASAPQRELWALRDLSFEIARGSVVGLVGRNGAGKTTLLRVLSRITRPTEGRAELRGRVASLLEVGTAFHPELSGRENIQMGAAVLGMRRADVAGRFDEIVDFAGVELFLDTPLKRYSTGMQMRLAFAVAAHLDPDVLLVDEVLAVGDLEFQRRCLGRLEETVHDGRTVIFASHQLQQLRRLTRECLWVEQGRLRAFGPTATVLADFGAAMASSPPDIGSGLAGASLGSWHLDGAAVTAPHTVTQPGPLTVVLEIDVASPVRGGEYGITLYDQDHRPMWSIAQVGLTLAPGRHRFIHRLASLPLRPGAYTWHPGLFDGNRWHTWRATPDLVVDTPLLSFHPREEFVGLLNVAGDLEVTPAEPRHAAGGTTRHGDKEALFASS